MWWEEEWGVTDNGGVNEKWKKNELSVVEERRIKVMMTNGRYMAQPLMNERWMNERWTSERWMIERWVSERWLNQRRMNERSTMNK